MDMATVAEFIRDCSNETKIYIGCDSERIRCTSNHWFARYTTVVVVHIDGKHGCKLFGETDEAPDFDWHKHKPHMRLMGEVYRVSDLYMKLRPLIKQEIEIHLDINPCKTQGSGGYAQEAIGYIRGTCQGAMPKLKPEALAASYAAERIINVEPAPPPVDFRWGFKTA